MDLHHLSFFRNRITIYSILILYIHLKYSTSCAIKITKKIPYPQMYNYLYYCVTCDNCPYLFVNILENSLFVLAPRIELGLQE